MIKGEPTITEIDDLLSNLEQEKYDPQEEYKLNDILKILEKWRESENGEFNGILNFDPYILYGKNLHSFFSWRPLFKSEYRVFPLGNDSIKENTFRIQIEMPTRYTQTSCHFPEDREMSIYICGNKIEEIELTLIYSYFTLSKNIPISGVAMHYFHEYMHSILMGRNITSIIYKTLFANFKKNNTLIGWMNDRSYIAFRNTEKIKYLIDKFQKFQYRTFIEFENFLDEHLDKDIKVKRLNAHKKYLKELMGLSEWDYSKRKDNGRYWIGDKEYDIPF